MGKFSESMIEELALQAARDRVVAEEPMPGEIEVRPNHAPKKSKSGSEWWPTMGPRGREIFLAEEPFILAHGEQGSGKTRACINKLIRHCYENRNARAVIAVLTRKNATKGGAWEKLVSDALPEWKAGIDLQGEGPNGEFVERRDDSQMRFLHIGTQDGGWAQVILLSLQHGEHIQSRMKGMEFSFFFFDELGETDSEEYFTKPIQRLRLQGMKNRQYVGATNPPNTGEDHWLYKRFFMPENQDNPANFRVIHVPLTENVWMDDKEMHIARIKESAKGDPTELARALRGLWVRRPRGDGIFAGSWEAERHVRGDMKEKTRIVPTKAWPFIIIGIDPGPANFCACFLQMPPNSDGLRFAAIVDEICHIGERFTYRRMVCALLRKMNFWCEVQATPFRFTIIADAAAFSNRTNDGRYESYVIEELIEDELRMGRDRYPALAHIERLKMRGCPKPPNSVLARTEMGRLKLDNDEIVVSATCTKVIEMFEHLECDEKKGIGHPLKNARGLIHCWDALAYPLFYYENGGRQPVLENEEKTESDFIAIG